MRRSQVLVAVPLIAALTACGAASGATPAARAPSSSAEGVSSSPAPAAVSRTLDELEAEVRATEPSLDLVPGTLVYLEQAGDERVIAIGVATRKPDRALQADDTVMLASVTKALVATVVMRLVEEGTLDLQDTVERWLPGAVPEGGQITLEQLLTMSSGLVSYDGTPDYPGSGVLPAVELLELVKDQPRPLMFDPGTMGASSNTNYAALQLVAEKATGEALPKLLRRFVLEPMHFDDLRLGGTPSAHGYNADEDVTVLDPEYPSAGAGGIGSVTDVGHFLLALSAGELVSPETFADMLSPRVEFEGAGYGLGVRIRQDLPCAGVFGQRGANEGYAIEAWANPTLDRTVVVAMTNGSFEGSATALADELLCDTGG